MKFRINTPRIACEQIEDETIVIDFDSGTYYSAGLIGSEIIRRLAGGSSLEDVLDYCRRRYAGEPGAVERGVREFGDSLLRESILVETDAGGAAPSEPLPPPPAGSIAFEAPVLNKYTDMKDLLLLDPIHEVDAQGWPIQKPDA
jgi:hypothetical protein